MNSKGFTLAEVVVTLSILALLTTIAIPTFISWLPKHNLQTSVRQIYDDLNLAKLEAVRRNTDVCITFNNVNSTYRVFLDNAPENGAYDAGETILKNSVTLEKDVTINNTITIGFNNRGMAATAPGSVNLSNPTGNTSVTVNLAGGISVP